MNKDTKRAALVITVGTLLGFGLVFGLSFGLPRGTSHDEHSDLPREHSDLLLERYASTAAPLLLDLHGAGMTPAAQRDFSWASECARRHAWNVVWPKGVGKTWNAGPGMYPPASLRPTDHVAELVALIERLNRTLGVTRVFVSGLSNGCAMSLRFGLEAPPHLVDAVACQSHAMHPTIRGRHGVPLLLLTASDDELFASEADVNATLAVYEEANGCAGGARTAEWEEPDVFVRRSCGGRIEHARYTNGGHHTGHSIRVGPRICAFFAAN